jgi:hypothetical protein
MKRPILLLLACAVSVWFLLVTNSPVAANAHGDQAGCSLETIKATYAIHSEGQFLGPGPFPVGPIGEAGMVTLDGKGNLTGQTTLNISGTSFPTSFTGTYRDIQGQLRLHHHHVCGANWIWHDVESERRDRWA